MKIICAESVLHGRAAFETVGDVAVLPDAEISRKDLMGADALVTRSKTKIDRELIEGAGLEFVGTATAGFDHIDTEALSDLGTHWTAAPGCNADSVAEYIVAALLEIGAASDLELRGLRMAIVGVGQVGSRVCDRARGLQIKPLLNDPPRAERENNAELRPLKEILPTADIVTLHTPLTDTGPHATRRLADSEFFEMLKPGTIFLNASRGEVVDEEALMAAMDLGRISHAVLDVWDNEPHCRRELLERVDIATPHVAGYSFDGKLRGTSMIYDSLCEFFGLEADWDSSALIPTSPIPSVVFDAAGNEQSELRKLVASIYDIQRDDQDMRPAPMPAPKDHALLFNRLRKEYYVRREFAGTQVKLASKDEVLRCRLAALGFEINR